MSRGHTRDLYIYIHIYIYERAEVVLRMGSNPVYGVSPPASNFFCKLDSGQRPAQLADLGQIRPYLVLICAPAWMHIFPGRRPLCKMTLALQFRSTMVTCEWMPAVDLGICEFCPANWAKCGGASCPILQLSPLPTKGQQREGPASAESPASLLL